VVTDQSSLYWDQWQRDRLASPDPWTDWGDHPFIQSWVFRHAFGVGKTLFNVFAEHLRGIEKPRALSLCCGDGAFERALVDAGVVHSVLGLDASPVRVEAAQRAAEGKPKCVFQVADLNALSLEAQQFDVVFAKAALHHIEALEVLADALSRVLRPSGLIIALDFFGPTRFQWTDAQLEWANRLLSNLPPSLRQFRDGRLYEQITRPSISDMMALDPTEAVRSSDIERVFGSRFETIALYPLGGTLVSLVVYGDLVNRYNPEDPEHCAYLERMLTQEHALIEQGVLPSDFRLWILA
jgi:SAM-dependent methyltransferase